ncbi:hypothetical protein LI291_00990 [Intestinibacillus massiliensis]|uniref:zinc ribbon domain-containing protein n=1 Tax=Intestinibacillus massiliensis TaxID=1871029 RepID=UPI000B35D5DC|nr:zinc ribbon domain-containing protein [Intestinibacillus massiliensis]MCB6364771.1 hypothetical protein [Intestinibacillus massiliensis]
MDPKVQMLLEKAKVLADKTGKAAVRAADSAGKKATEMAQATRLNLQIFDLNTECEVLYKEIGKIVYDIHVGIETPEEEMESRIAKVDENRARVAELKAKIADAKAGLVCPNCGKPCNKDDGFCSSCGAQL